MSPPTQDQKTVECLPLPFMYAMTNLRFRMRRCVLPHAEVTEEVAGAMQVDLPLSPPGVVVHADKEEAATDHPQLSQIQVSLFPGGDDLCDEQLVSYELGRKVIASGFLLPHILRSFLAATSSSRSRSVRSSVLPFFRA